MKNQQFLLFFLRHTIDLHPEKLPRRQHDSFPLFEISLLITFILFCYCLIDVFRVGATSVPRDSHLTFARQTSPRS